MHLQDESDDGVCPRVGLSPTDAEHGDTFGKPAMDIDDMGDTEEAIDKCIGAQLLVDWDGDPLCGEVIERATDPSGNRIGRAHRHPMLDTRECLVKFNDESIKRCTANQIAQAMHSQVDHEGESRELVEEIIGHKSDGSAVTKENGCWISRNGNKTPKKTTRGWKPCVRFKDGTIDWFGLKDIKESHPLELAECAVNNGIADEPAFNWWVPHMIRTRNRIVGEVKKRPLGNHPQVWHQTSQDS